MIGAHYALVIGLAISGQTHSDAGAISGIVVNASQGGVPAAHAEVVLRVQVDGQFVPAAETVADAQGRFHFPDLPADAGFVYLPGANRDDVHYPGKRLRLTAARPEVDVKLKVCDSIAHPCPLVIKRQDILIRPEPGALHVTESLLVSNPTRTTYVGQAKKEAAEPVTLQLSIPSDFDRTTFHKEFFGRRFSIAGGKLVTGVPWTPGEQELKFTYTLRNEEKYRLWQRPLDLPCDNLRLSVEHDKPEQVSCNLAPASETQSDALIFESHGTTLPAGHVIRVELGRLPLPWMAYAKWAAFAVLVGLIAVVSVMLVLQKRRAKTQPSDSASAAASPQNRPPTTTAKSRRKSQRNRRRRAA